MIGGMQGYCKGDAEWHRETRSQATPMSSQMITMARMLEEKDDQIAALTAQRDIGVEFIKMLIREIPRTMGGFNINLLMDDAQAALAKIKEQK